VRRTFSLTINLLDGEKEKAQPGKRLQPKQQPTYLWAASVTRAQSDTDFAFEILA